ncbi:hypothetical protein HOL21_00325 [Candidatus Woesearchaeota archaeon]|jgi:biotin synthase-like enzyme|nr:hypothetical protein [Candidatus Woesearchaeota archaeon]MBT5396643.1 hypothetical protein [Candidatus Woesearchaeota archaeon]MBT5924660.1 hypothetical protein [Candidatus Woesearchaeota archaeon]MBT6367570.1 hypothetical protein [Candidatus Woesearchaeota archaeon]MBT7763069.1 hypothetical protein [Candidatus Woesearchaeota archaeon]
MSYNPNKFIHVNDITIQEETKELLTQAESIYWQNFNGKTWYGRCIFISWYCSVGDCKFCFRSTQKHKIQHPEHSKRSIGSILLEALFCKVFNWRIEFLTGGYGIMPFPQLFEIIKNVSLVYGEKIWLNLGVISNDHVEEIRPYVKGICSSMETLTPELHKYVCPNKPIEPYDTMFSHLEGFQKSIAIIVGLGDTVEDMKYLFDFITKHNLDRITVYALKPVLGTEYTEGPSPDEFVQWLARLRIQFPKLEIIAGTNLRRSEECGYLMKAGANAMTKFPATKQFATKKAKLVEKLIQKEKRDFISTLSVLPEIDWNNKIDELPIEQQYKDAMKDKLAPYLEKFQNPVDIDTDTTVF